MLNKTQLSFQETVNERDGLILERVCEIFIVHCLSLAVRLNWNQSLPNLIIKLNLFCLS